MTMNYYVQQQGDFHDVYCDMVRIARCGSPAGARKWLAIVLASPELQAIAETRA